MKIYVVFDTEGCVHAAYRNREDGEKYLTDLYDKMVGSPNFHNVGMANGHIWWDEGSDERHVIIREVELK